MKDGMDVSVVIPVYNSSQILPDLVARLHPVLERSYDRYELILVNDGSRDASWQVIGALVEKHPWVRRSTSCGTMASTMPCCPASGWPGSA